MINKIYNEIKYLIKIKEVKQTIFLFSSFIVVTLSWVFTSSIITRTLWPSDYWKLSLVLSLVSFFWLFFEFWYFSSWTRLLWIEKNKEKERSLFWTLIIISSIISLIFFFFLIFSSFLIDLYIYPKEDIWKYFLFLSPFLFIYPMSYMLPQAMQWMNKMEINAVYNWLKPILYLIFILIFSICYNLNIYIVLILLQISLLISILYSIVKIKPIFLNIKSNLVKYKKENQIFWKHIYLWRVFEQSTFHLDKILIAFFLSSTEVGFYSLALLIASPISMVSVQLSRSLYKKFSNMDFIPKKVILYNITWLFGSWLILFLIGNSLILFLFWKWFIEVWNILWLVIIANTFQGMYQPYLMFLHWKWLKKLGTWNYIWGTINIILNVLLIQRFWIIWALIATIITYVFWNIYLYSFYKNYNKTND